MAIAEIGIQTDYQVARSVTPERAEPGLLYNSLGAKRLATEYLSGKRYEVIRDNETNPEFAYVKGKMDVRARVLTMIGQIHILTLNERLIDVDNPPMQDIRPVPKEELEELVNYFKSEQLFLRESGFFGRGIIRISVQEAEALGHINELKVCLAGFGINIR